MFDDAAAGGAIGDDSLAQKPFVPLSRIVAPRALQACDFTCGAMQFQHIHAAGLLMELIDVLRYHPTKQPCGLAACEHPMAGVWLARRKVAVGRCFLTPVFRTCRWVGQKVAEEHRRTCRPHAAWRAKIGDPAFGADPRPGECDRCA
jgi:hypothetical protein